MIIFPFISYTRTILKSISEFKFYNFLKFVDELKQSIQKANTSIKVSEFKAVSM
jgi:hypothetical protein